MGTPLGTGAGNKIIFNVFNNHASDTITAGHIAELVVTAIGTHDYLTEDPVFTVLPGATNDTALGAGGVAFGIAEDDIAAQTYGEVCVFGLTKAAPDATDLVAGDVAGIGSDTDQLIDAASAAEQAPCAVWLGATSVAGTLDWAFVDFISGSFGGNAADAVVATFWGQAY